MSTLSPLPEDERRIATAFDLAMSQGFIRPAFQPIVHLDSGAISSFEVLARWTDEALGVISPTIFIPIAERRGFIAPLTAHLISTACIAARDWGSKFRLAFNISPLHFQDGEMPGLLENAVGEAGFPLVRTQIEITETAIIDDLAVARATIDQLRAKGVRILLDDFGTGYSSLTRLQALPFDKIKIDASFVRSMEESSDSRKIVGAVIGLGQSLGVPAVAEGVENEAQAEMLHRLGCEFVQGWLFSRAVPPEEVPSLLCARGEMEHDQLSLSFTRNQRLAQLEALYTAAPVGICFVDRDLRILDANRRFAEMMGMTVKDLFERRVGEIGPTSPEYPLSDLARAVGGEPIPPRMWSLPAGLRTGLLNVAPAHDENGKLIGLSLVVTDLPDT